jgi:hypothetical protein
MKIKRIEIPYVLNDLDIFDTNIDVIVETDTGFQYTVVVGTAKNIESYMDRGNSTYYPLGDRQIIVKKVTREVVEEAIKAYAEKDDGYWLKFYSFALNINPTVFDQLEAESIEEGKKFNEK